MNRKPLNALVLINPISGRGRGEACIKQAPDLFSSNGLNAQVTPLTGPGALEQLIREQAGEYDLVVVGGGDGTINTAAKAIYQHHPNMPLGLIPLGLSNCLTRHLGIGFDLAESIEVIAHGKTTKLDIGLFQDKIFLAFLGAGFDAEVVERTAGARKGTITNWAYAKAGWRVFFKGLWPELEVVADGNKIAGVYYQAILIGVSNYARFFSAPAPNGFELYLFKHFGRAGLFRSFLRLGNNRRLDKAADLKIRVREHLGIYSRNGAGMFQYDGEKGGLLPLEAKIAPGALTVIRP